MLRIGDFSILSRIGIRTLRYYDNFGLLKPMYIDDSTNYRYYCEEQLILANRIEALRAMGMSLGDIKKFLHHYESAKDVKEFLMTEYSKKQNEISQLQAQLSRLQTAIQHFENEDYNYHCNITIKEIPSRKVISIRGMLPAYAQEGTLWEVLSAECEKQSSSSHTGSHYNDARRL